MPNTSHHRRRAPLPSTKLTILPDSDGWSTVTRRSHPPAPSSISRTTASSRNIPYQGQSLDGLTAQFSHTSLQDLSEHLTPAQLSYYHFLTSAEKKGDKVVVVEKEKEKVYPEPRAARYTAEELKKRFDKTKEAWRGSGGRNVVKGLMGRVLGDDGESEVVEKHRDNEEEGDTVHECKVEARPRASGRDGNKDGRQQKITKLLCLGLGSPSADASGWRCVVLWQLVVFLDMAESFFPHTSLYAQDPIFNAVDIAFLTSLSIIVLPTPPPTFLLSPPKPPPPPSGSSDQAAETHNPSSLPPSPRPPPRKILALCRNPYPDSPGIVDENTLVYAPHFPIAYWTPEMRTGKVGVVIGNDVERGLERIPTPATLRTLFSRVLPAPTPGPPATNPSKPPPAHDETSPLLSNLPSTTYTSYPPPTHTEKQPLKTAQVPTPYDLREIPDLQTHTELSTFLSSFSSAKWPEPEECVGAFNDMCVYWRGLGGVGQ